MELEKKVAIITGGGTGIGKATALLFAREGASVVIAGRREDVLQKTVKEITVNGGKAHYVVTDHTNEAQVKELFEKTIALFGKIDILFNNAGVFITGHEAHEFPLEDWERIMRGNFWGTLICSRNVVPYLKKNGGGVIINCSSVSGRLPQRKQSPYNVSKAAIEMLSKIMTLELGPSNIRVNTICPNLTETDMAAKAIATNGREKYESSFPLRRLGKPEDTANAALYLASDRASWVSGNSFFVDGGANPL